MSQITTSWRRLNWQDRSLGWFQHGEHEQTLQEYFTSAFEFESFKMDCQWKTSLYALYIMWMRNYLTLMFSGLISIPKCMRITNTSSCGERPASVPQSRYALLCARLQNEDRRVSCLNFKEVSHSSDYWFPNARAELIKKYMQIAILAGAYFCTLQCGTICLPVSQVRRCIRGITRQTPWGRDALFAASLPIAVNSLALPKRHSCLLFHRQMALTKCLLQY